MLTSDVEATAQAVADGLEDLSDALNELPWDVDDGDLVASLAATSRAFARMLDLLDGAA